MGLVDLIEGEKTVLLDGAMGTEMLKRGIPLDGTANIDCPEAISEIHKSYLDAGSEILLTCTFSMNRLYMQTHKMEMDILEGNKGAVKAAKDACEEGQYLLGDLGPTGQLLAPIGSHSEDDFYENYKEQAAILADCGVDGFMIETMGDLRETRCALRACIDSSSLPVFVSLVFSKTPRGFFTMMGDPLEKCALELSEEGASVIGSNCGDLDPLEIVELVRELKSFASVPIMAKPNAGKPRLVGKETVYDMSPDDFAKGLKTCVDAGAKFVGGCCGTSPAHILRVKESL